MNSPKPSASPMEGQHHGWIPVLELATEEVFETMLGSHLAVAAEPVVEDGLGITAMVGLAGVLCGVLTIRCSSRAGALMASKMLGGDAEKGRQEIWDALGEICNMVAGNFKNKISGLGDGCMLSVPTVITGEDYSCHSSGESNAVRVDFMFEEEGMIVNLDIQSA